jgi:uncharacterized CHY-type Zn-finger protein
MSDPNIACPHCEHASEDPFGVLDADVVDAMRCEECAMQFWFAIMECHACAGEHAFSWIHQPAAAALLLLKCGACGNTFRRHDAAVDTAPG